MSKHSNTMPPPTNSFDDSLCQLRHAVGVLEKVNYQLFQLLKTLHSPAPCKPPQ